MKLLFDNWMAIQPDAVGYRTLGLEDTRSKKFDFDVDNGGLQVQEEVSLSTIASATSLLAVDAGSFVCGCCGGNYKNHNYAVFGAANGLSLEWVAPEAGAIPFLDQSEIILAGADDDVPDDFTTTDVLTVDGPSIISTLYTIGDQDFFQIELEAGTTYQIGQYAALAGPNGVPLVDAFLELYNSDQELVATADGGGPNTPSGLDALMTFVATETGTYYVNARSYDQLPGNGTTGDFVGDYELFAVESDPALVIPPRYDIDSPLHSLDWGPTLDGSSRDPDGDDGPRDNGADHMGSANPYGIEGKNVITYYFADLGEIYITEDPTNPGLFSTGVNLGWRDFEKDAFRAAFDEYERVTDNVYIEVTNIADAHFKFYSYAGTPGPGASILGDMAPPGELDEGEGHFNIADQRWTEDGLKPGGSAFNTILHELGHGHGMSHPHDNGGESSVMQGHDDNGDVIGGPTAAFGLSQGVFTVMSYNDGWTDSPYGTPDFNSLPDGSPLYLELGDRPYGDAGTLSPLDIAVLQDKYGVNEDTNTGDDVYELGDVNGPGTFYSSIWDADGIDEISYLGTMDASINLNAASLLYEEGGGGFVSYVWGIFGGFTIANGVTIENATTGRGEDSLIGNDVANELSGNQDSDFIDGRAGDDFINGGSGNDDLSGGEGHDTIYGHFGNDLIDGGVGDDLIKGHNGHDVIDGGIGNDMLRGENGDDLITGGEGDDIMLGGAGRDIFFFSDEAGDDVIRDFGTNPDKMDFSGSSEITDYADLIANHLAEVDGDAVISGVDFSITLEGVSAASLAESDFVF